MARLIGEVAEFREEIRTARTHARAMASGIGSMFESAELLRGDIGALQANMSAVRANMSAVRANMSAVRANMSAVRANMSAVQANLDVMTTHLDATAGSVARPLDLAEDDVKH